MSILLLLTEQCTACGLAAWNAYLWTIERPKGAAKVSGKESVRRRFHRLRADHGNTSYTAESYPAVPAKCLELPRLPESLSKVELSVSGTIVQQ